MNKKITGLFDGYNVNIGDKHLTVSNVEDITSYRVFIIDDVYEISPRENVYECTVIRYMYKEGKTYSNN